MLINCRFQSPHQVLNKEQPGLGHLQIFGSSVYVLIHEEKRTRKLEKWAPWALLGQLVGYDGHTIYRVFIKEQNKVIRVKDLCIYKDHNTKSATNLPHFENTLTFQGFRLEDDNKPKSTLIDTRSASTPHTEDIPQKDTAMQPQKSRVGRTVKPTDKVKHAKRGNKRNISKP